MRPTAVLAAAVVSLGAVVAAVIYCPESWRPAAEWHAREGLKLALGAARVDRFWPQPLRVMGPAELQHHGGTRGPPGAVLVSIGGRVYDTQRSRNLYGDAGWYRYFAGRDATRVFGTGRRIGNTIDPNIGEGVDPDDHEGLPAKQLRQIAHYSGVFQRKYPLVGLLEGRHFDAEGRPTAARRALERDLAAAQAATPGDQGQVQRDAEEDGAFAIDDEEGEQETKCPVLRAGRAVRQAAQQVAELLTPLLGYSRQQPGEREADSDLSRRKRT
eukprot:TRINITY_DN24423_c0_g1_i1.p2 TRINITY_DN24423_c0_g1~~TRINITY_DN24423_c0_g1_i1.p2  ORF type:complete len:271 (+),score=81.00 TRINITY_DN24423_c0_g1_i1:74-886(+)